MFKSGGHKLPCFQLSQVQKDQIDMVTREQGMKSVFIGSHAQTVTALATLLLRSCDRKALQTFALFHIEHHGQTAMANA